MDYRTTPQGILILVALATSLQLTPSLAFQSRSVGNLREVVPALLGSDPAPAPVAATTRRSELGLGVLSFESVAAADDRNLAVGWFAQSTPALGYFTAVGARLPGAAEEPSEGAAPLPGVGPADPSGGSALPAVKPWLGAGLRWGASERLHLSLEGRWSPGDLALLDSGGTARDLRFGVSLDLPW